MPDVWSPLQSSLLPLVRAVGQKSASDVRCMARGLELNFADSVEQKFS